MSAANKLVINKHKQISVINKNIYGHFSEHLGRCIYGGLFLNGKINLPVAEALKKIKIPVLRWPGGCFADEYHWKDGIGPLAERKKMVNTNWGGVTEDNSIGTHEFLELCEFLGCEPYINGNLGSGTVQEMSEWVEYLNAAFGTPMSELRKNNGREKPWNVKYFGVGNENWGCGGNMRPEYYADVYRRYQTYLRTYGDNKIYKIACGPSDCDYNWTKVVMEQAGKYMDALTLHYYIITHDWQHKGSATDFTEEEYYITLKKALLMDEYIENHSRIMDKYDPDNKVALFVDEWGAWHDVAEGTNPGFLYQQNTMRDAVAAACTLNIFNNRSRRVKMANIAQVVNVLQALILTNEDKMLLTPTYHVFDLYKAHQDAACIESYVQTQSTAGVPDLHVSASVANDETITITLANLSYKEERAVDCELGASPKSVTARVLTGKPDAYNDFNSNSNVTVKPLTGVSIKDGGFSATLPPCSVTAFTVI